MLSFFVIVERLIFVHDLVIPTVSRVEHPSTTRY